MMYGGFTDNAQNALNTAQQFAQANGFNYVGTEHILYGIASGGSACTGPAAGVTVMYRCLG